MSLIDPNTHPAVATFLSNTPQEYLKDTLQARRDIEKIIQHIQNHHGERYDDQESDDSDCEDYEKEKWLDHQAFNQPTSDKIHRKIEKIFSSCLTWLHNRDNLDTANLPLPLDKKSLKKIKKSGISTGAKSLGQFIQEAAQLSLTTIEKKILTEYNEALHNNDYIKALEIANKNGIMIAHYRGLHFKPQKMGISTRRELRSPAHKKTTYYSEEVVNKVQKNHSTQNHETLYLNHRQNKEALQNQHQKTAKTLSKLAKIGPIIMPSHRFNNTPYLYNHLLHYLLEAYSHGVPCLKNTLHHFRQHPQWQAITPQKNPFISTSIRARHAIRYALGSKEPHPQDALKPNYHPDGHPSYPHTGKVILKLSPVTPHTPSEYANIPNLGASAQLTSKEEHIVEQETTFFGALENCLHEHIIRFPNFRLAWQDFFACKYGINKNTFTILQKIYPLLKPNSLMAELIEKVIAEILCLLLEPKLHNIAQLHARKAGKMLFYQSNEGYLSATPPNARLYIKGEKHKATRTQRHLMTHIRLLLAQHCLSQTDPERPLLNFTTRIQALRLLRHWHHSDNHKPLSEKLDSEYSSEEKKHMVQHCLALTRTII